MELDAPNVGKIEKRYLEETIDKGFVSTFGPYVPEFEAKFADYLSVKKAISTQSGTASIHIALYELGIGRGDEVIVPALTFVATVNPVIYVGAKPKTKAIIPVHFYGNVCNMDAIMQVAKKYNLRVIEDATESLGAKYNGKHAGTFGDLGCFSFNGNKIITTGGGGMVVGDDIDRLNRIKSLVNQGRDETKGHYYSEIGFNYRMTNIEAALGLAQMERLDLFLKRKKVFNSIYREEFKKVNSVRFQEKHEEAESSWWFSCAIFEKNIVVLQKKLKEKGIPTRRIFMPIMEFSPYKAHKHTDYGNSYHIYERGLCLPSSTLNSENDIYYTCKVLKELT